MSQQPRNFAHKAAQPLTSSSPSLASTNHLTTSSTSLRAGGAPPRARNILLEALAAGNAGAPASIDDLVAEAGQKGDVSIISPRLSQGAFSANSDGAAGRGREVVHVGPGGTLLVEGDSSRESQDADMREAASGMAPVTPPRYRDKKASIASSSPPLSSSQQQQQQNGHPKSTASSAPGSSNRVSQATRQPDKSIYETVFGASFKDLVIQSSESSSSNNAGSTANHQQQQRRKDTIAGPSSSGTKTQSSPHAMQGIASILTQAASSPQLGSPSRPGGPPFDPHNDPPVLQKRNEYAVAFREGSHTHHHRRPSQHSQSQAFYPNPPPNALASPASRSVYADDHIPSHRAITGAITPGTSPSTRRTRLPSYAGLGIMDTPPSGSSASPTATNAGAGPSHSPARGRARLGSKNGSISAAGAAGDPLAFLPNGHVASSLAQDLGVTQGASRSRNPSVSGWRNAQTSNSRGGHPGESADDAAERDRVANLLAAMSDERNGGKADADGGENSGSSKAHTPPHQRVPNNFARPQGHTPRTARVQDSALRQLHSPVLASNRKGFAASPLTNGKSRGHTSEARHGSAAAAGSESRRASEAHVASQEDEGEAAQLMLLLATSPSPATESKHRSRFAGATPSLLPHARSRTESNGIGRALFQPGDFDQDDHPEEAFKSSQESNTSGHSLAPPATITSSAETCHSTASSLSSTHSTQESNTATTRATSLDGEKDTSSGEREALKDDDEEDAEARIPRPITPPNKHFERLPHASVQDQDVNSIQSDSLGSSDVPLPVTPPGNAPRTPKAPGTNFSYAEFINVSPSPQPRSRRTPRMRGVSATGVFEGTPSKLDTGHFADLSSTFLQRGPLTFGDAEMMDHFKSMDGSASPAQQASMPLHNHARPEEHGWTGESPTKRARLALDQ